MLTLLIAACAAPTPPGSSGPGRSPDPSPAPSPSPSPSAPPSPSPGSEAGLYLRAWRSQALAPEHTFGWLPTLVIHDGLALDGNVAIPMIYPGPLMVLPNARRISEEGQAAIETMARDLGLLDGDIDFTDGNQMPGGTTGHIVISVDGQDIELIGDPDAAGRCTPGDLRCRAEPGTAEAFAFFWARLSYLDDWLEQDLGGPIDYTPERLAVALTPPIELEVPAQPVAWPLEAPLADFGTEWVLEGSRCAVVEGDDLATLLPVMLAANQASIFVDDQDSQAAAIARVLLPGEPAPCDLEALSSAR